MLFITIKILMVAHPLKGILIEGLAYYNCPIRRLCGLMHCQVGWGVNHKSKGILDV